MQTQTILEIINHLSHLDLSTYPYSKAKQLIGMLGKIGVIVVTLHPRKRIFRARPNCNGEHFSKVSDISYKPAHLNNTFQRASTPNMTMFYGSIIPENIKIGELNNSRLIGSFEVVNLLRNPESSGEQVLTYGKWIVTKKINLFAVLFHQNFLDKSSYTRELYNGYHVFLNKFPKFKTDSFIISTFFANEFAKSFTPNDYNYLLSACFTEMAVEKNLAGVLYPSVRVEGAGFNVAIHPHYVDNCMELEAVGECTVYKRRRDTKVDNDLVALVLAGQKEFELKPVLPQFHWGRERIIKLLYPDILINKRIKM